MSQIEPTEPTNEPTVLTLPAALSREVLVLAARAANLKALAEQAEQEMQRRMAELRLVYGLPDEANLKVEFTVEARLEAAEVEAEAQVEPAQVGAAAG